MVALSSRPFGFDVTDNDGYTVAGPYRSIVKAWRVARNLNRERRS